MYSPLRAGKNKTDSEGWDQTLVRFRAHFDTLYTHNEQPSGGLVPEVALATIVKSIKEDLEQSVSNFFYCVFVHRFTNLATWQQPLRNKKAGKGERSRDVEAYLEGLLHAIHRAGAAAVPVGDGSIKRSTTVTALSRGERSFA